MALSHRRDPRLVGAPNELRLSCDRPERATAREIFQALTGHCVVPDYKDLRPTRRAKNLTLTATAQHLGVWPSRIGELELGQRPNNDLAHRYREWLTAA